MNALLVVGLIAGMIVMIVLASVCAWCCDYFAPGSKNNKVGPAGAGEVEMNAMDAMIHGLRIKDGNATYVSRYVRTSRLKQEEALGGAKFQKVYISSYMNFKFCFLCLSKDFHPWKQRYVYGSIMDSIVKVTAIVKFDLRAEPDIRKTKLEVGGNVHGIFELGAGRFGSEPIFVPRQPDTNSEEDDGYLIHFVHDENTSKSSVNVIDAKTMSADPVAVVELPSRVPYGLHALFVTEEQLEEQAKL
ncbi:hypothetical protein POM88_053510 [Heracleum sosnowskyi]|uniref:carotenoid 9,10-dioxygenase n=1 Tax=Heracleum sosnowskyi TaxID=360622 RepID=A0AAD8LX09_9APIA|nr:hypothetical protein POM88_053510 [Heracleum sosnowskyi]